MFENEIDQLVEDIELAAAISKDFFEIIEKMNCCFDHELYHDSIDALNELLKELQKEAVGDQIWDACESYMSGNKDFFCDQYKDAENKSDFLASALKQLDTENEFEVIMAILSTLTSRDLIK